MSESSEAKQFIAAVERVPRWPAAMALIVIGLAYLLLPDELIFGPRWLLLIVGLVALILFPFIHQQEWHKVSRMLGLGTTVLATIAITLSSIFLLTGLQNNQTPAPTLLRDAALIWCINVVTFALWYWEIDGGGPAKRRVGHHTSSDFLFPQMTMDDENSQRWSPTFIDYLFLAFNTSTAFSPTDTLVLSRHAKLLMMLQSIISLIVIAVLAARAVNTL